MKLKCRVLAAGCAVALLLAGAPPVLSAESEIRLRVSERSFNFGAVLEDESVTHTFEIENVGREPLEITNVLASAPLFFKNVRKQILPGERRSISISLGIPRSPGEYEGGVEVAFKNPGLTDVVFEVSGRIVPLIEFSPFPVFFVATQRGQSKQTKIDITNHEPDPLEIYRIEHSGTRFTTELKAVEPGQRYTLTLTLDGKGAPGKASELIKLFTSSKKKPVIQVQANTYIKDRVYTFPGTLDWGRIRLGELKAQPTLTNYLSQTLMVYQNGGTNFQVTARTASPFLRLSTEPSKFKDRYEITVNLVPERLRGGSVDSRIVIATNDKEFPTLEVPITAVVEGQW